MGANVNAGIVGVLDVGMKVGTGIFVGEIDGDFVGFVVIGDTVGFVVVGVLDGCPAQMIIPSNNGRRLTNVSPTSVCSGLVDPFYTACIFDVSSTNDISYVNSAQAAQTSYSSTTKRFQKSAGSRHFASSLFGLFSVLSTIFLLHC